MNDWLDDVTDATTRLMCSQWAALGASLATEPCRRAVVDPEALLVATCAFGRSDARIFDEAIDWILVNHGLLKPWRLKHISREFGPDVQRALGAALDSAREISGMKDLMPGVLDEARKAAVDLDTRPLFLHEKGLYDSGAERADPLFMKWKLLRGAPRIRKHSGTPDMRNPANIMVRLRCYYGTGTKADVITCLLTGGGGSSREIASRIKYRQSGVYRVLEQLVDADMVQKFGGRGGARYWIEGKGLEKSLGLEGRLPVFFVWGNIFNALHMIVADRREHQAEYRSDFFSAERMRDLTARVVPLIRKAGGPLEEIRVPDVKRQRGGEHADRLIAFVKESLEVLKSFALEE